MFTCALLLGVLTLTFTVTDAAITMRHAYISAIPFSGMKLNAPVLTSYTMTSRSQCGLKCMETAGCQSINYHAPTLRCEVLADYLCTGNSELITAAGYRYYDVEKNENPQAVAVAHAHQQCKLDARCSTKCQECTSIGFDTFDNHYLQPDNVAAALVPAANMASCMFQCTSKPLPECRGVNTKEGDSECMHLTFLRSERGPERYVFDDEYKYHQRTCLIY